MFILVDCNYSLLMVKRLNSLSQVKHVYHTEEFNDINKLCFRLTHDLIKHYGELGDQLTAEKRNQEAREMFFRAKQLSRSLFH